MWTRNFILTAALVGLAACQPAIPDSAAGVTSRVPDPGRGVGFNNSLEEIRAREAALARSQPTVIQPPNGGGIPTAAGAAGQTTPVSRTATLGAPQTRTTQLQPTTPVQTRPIQTQPVPSQQAQVSTAGRDPELLAIEARADADAARANSGQQVVNASPSNAAPRIVNNPGISSEQDFGSVSSRRSIEADAARIASNRAQLEVVQPTELPSRQGNSQPNIVAYALQTKHARGTRVHRRVSLSSASRYQRNCAVFATNDEAQIAFLANGGPQRDRKGLDPDGDGYACGWDPAPFRRIGG